MKLKFYEDCNRKVALLCNHQRAVPKNHEESMAKAYEKINEKKAKLKMLKKLMSDFNRGDFPLPS